MHNNVESQSISKITCGEGRCQNDRKKKTITIYREWAPAFSPTPMPRLFQEADMSMVPMSINHIRNEAVDFSETLFVDEHRITFKRPVPEADITGFVKPFTPTVTP